MRDIHAELPMHIAMLVAMADAAHANVLVYRLKHYPGKPIAVILRDIRSLELMDALQNAGFAWSADDPGTFTHVHHAGTGEFR